MGSSLLFLNIQINNWEDGRLALVIQGIWEPKVGESVAQITQ